MFCTAITCIHHSTYHLDSPFSCFPYSPSIAHTVLAAVFWQLHTSLSGTCRPLLHVPWNQLEYHVLDHPNRISYQFLAWYTQEWVLILSICLQCWEYLKGEGKHFKNAGQWKRQKMNCGLSQKIVPHLSGGCGGAVDPIVLFLIHCIA